MPSLCCAIERKHHTTSVLPMTSGPHWPLTSFRRMISLWPLDLSLRGRDLDLYAMPRIMHETTHIPYGHCGFRLLIMRRIDRFANNLGFWLVGSERDCDVIKSPCPLAMEFLFGAMQVGLVPRLTSIRRNLKNISNMDYFKMKQKLVKLKQNWTLQEQEQYDPAW